MSTHRRSSAGTRRLCAAAALCALAACGSNHSAQSPDRPAPAKTSTAGGAAPGAACGRAPAPGHEAVDLRANGVACDVARTVAVAAAGRGRAPYIVDGFACEPSPAGDGDTNYTCTRGDDVVRFRWGVA